MAKKIIEKRHQLHKRSSAVTGGFPKSPTPEQLELGEIAINFAQGNERLWIKNSNGDIVGFMPLPTVSSSDNGKVLMVVNGAWAAMPVSALYTGANAPDDSQGNNGDLYTQTD